MAKKKKVKHHRLTAEQRPLFAPAHKVHATAIDKANKRQNIKLSIKRELNEM